MSAVTLPSLTAATNSFQITRLSSLPAALIPNKKVPTAARTDIFDLSISFPLRCAAPVNELKPGRRGFIPDPDGPTSGKDERLPHLSGARPRFEEFNIGEP